LREQKYIVDFSQSGFNEELVKIIVNKVWWFWCNVIFEKRDNMIRDRYNDVETEENEYKKKLILIDGCNKLDQR
jgi:hypothetical protein